MVAVSQFMGAQLIPITRENFDMVLEQSTYLSKGIQDHVEVFPASASASNISEAMDSGIRGKPFTQTSGGGKT